MIAFEKYTYVTKGIFFLPPKLYNVTPSPLSLQHVSYFLDFCKKIKVPPPPFTFWKYIVILSMCVFFRLVAGLCIIGCLLCCFFWCKSCRCHYKKICPLRKGSQALLESSSSSSLDHLSTLSSSSASSSGSSQWDIFTFLSHSKPF